LTLLSLWAPVVFVMGLIFTASSLSDPGAPPGGLSDKSAHIIAYAALGATLVRALGQGRSAAVTPRRVLIAALLATLYGMSDELHQWFVPGRNAEWLDVAADALGGVIGAAGWALAVRAAHGTKNRKRTRSAGL